MYKLFAKDYTTFSSAFVAARATSRSINDAMHFSLGDEFVPNSSEEYLAAMQTAWQGLQRQWQVPDYGTCAFKGRDGIFYRTLGARLLMAIIIQKGRESFKLVLGTETKREPSTFVSGCLEAGMYPLSSGWDKKLELLLWSPPESEDLECYDEEYSTF